MTRLVRNAWALSPALSLLLAVAVVLTVVASVLSLTVDTLVMGAPAWNKPLKFALSFLAFVPALLWVYSRIERPGRWIRLAMEIVGWSMIAELVLISFQAARGVPSHFNYSSVLDTAVFQAMAAGVGTFAVVIALTAVLIARRNLGGSALSLGMKLGLSTMLVGGVSAFTMTSPRPGQIEAGLSTIGGHAIGGPDGGPGLPLLGWSTEFGDARVVHFIGLHGLQVLPLAALVVMWLARRGRVDMPLRQQRVALWLIAVSYWGLMLTAFVQARRGQSVVDPDPMTWLMLGVLVAVPAAAAVVTLAWCPQGSRRSADGGDQPAMVMAADSSSHQMHRG